MKPRRGPERLSNTFSKSYTISAPAVFGVGWGPHLKAHRMTSACKHGFPPGQCASCRACPHGLTASGCGRCQAAAAAASRRRVVAPPAEGTASHDHLGYEIFYVPEVNGWQFRGPDAAPSAESYRSVFLARKAIDHLSASTRG
jgi:hypothetical protein